MLRGYFSLIKNFKENIEELRKFANEYYDGKKDSEKEIEIVRQILHTKRFSEPIYNLILVNKILDLLEIDESLPHNIEIFTDLLKNPITMRNINNGLDLISNVFDENKDDIFKEIEKLSFEEQIRLEEGIYTLYNGCFFSSIAMSTSALESRLFEILKRKNEDGLKGYSYKGEIERLTLGDLSGIYLQHKKEFNNIIPEKHERILETCNQIRIFAVHPKKEYLNKKDARAILNQVFSFLLDERCRIKKNKS